MFLKLHAPLPSTWFGNLLMNPVVHPFDIIDKLLIMAEKYTIYHNPRCRKSREALNFLIEEKVDLEVIKYLDDPIQPKDFKLLLARLDLKVSDIIRKEEQLFKQKYKGFDFTDEEWFIVLEENPKLLQRPIVVKGSKAVIGRPLENVKNLLN